MSCCLALIQAQRVIGGEPAGGRELAQLTDGRGG